MSPPSAPTAQTTVFRQLTFKYRKPGTTAAAFKKHWSTIHTDLAIAIPIFQEKVLRYEQLYPLDGEEYIEFPGGLKCDGVVVMDFRTLEDREALIAAPAYREVLYPDTVQFADLDAVERIMVQRVTMQG